MVRAGKKVGERMGEGRIGRPHRLGRRKRVLRCWDGRGSGRVCCGGVVGRNFGRGRGMTVWDGGAVRRDGQGC